MEPAIIGLVAFMALFLFLISGVPVVFCLFLLGMIGLGFISGWGVMLRQLGTTTYTAVHIYGLTVVPLFVLIGEVVFKSGIGSALLTMAQKWLSRLPGGMASAVVVANAFFAAMSGAGIAASALFAKLAVPDMQKHGYDVELATGSVAAAGPLAAMIPPSVVMVIFSMLSDTNLGELLIAGVLPGIMIAVILILMIGIRCKLKPSLAPPTSGVSWKERFKSLGVVWPVLLIIISILGSIYAGIATPTEAAAIGALMTILVVAARRNISRRGLFTCLYNTIITSSMILVIYVGGRVFGSMIVVSGLPRLFSEFVLEMGLSPMLIVVMFMAMYAVLGCFIEAITMMVLTLPIIMPIIYQLGFSDIWFGILTVCVVLLGAITPPFGICLFATKGGLTGTSAEGVTVMQIARGSIPFMICYIIALAILMAFPEISLLLPGLMK